MASRGVGAARRCAIQAARLPSQLRSTCVVSSPWSAQHQCGGLRSYAVKAATPGTTQFYDQQLYFQPHPTQRPDDPAYFTGNPIYYNTIMKLNSLIRKHGLDFHNSAPYDSLPAKPKWMTIEEMRNLLDMKLREGKPGAGGMYATLVHKLNLLYTVQAKDPQVFETLSGFVKPGQNLVVQERPPSTVDEFGRSYTWGSRKTAKAQTWIVEGSGSLYVNGVPMADYFAEEVDREAVVKPLELARCVGNYNVWAVVQGGGLSGQAGAVALAVARGLIIHEPQVEPLLKEAGLLTPDTRQVERKKTGQPKARKKYTWVKR